MAVHVATKTFLRSTPAGLRCNVDVSNKAMSETGRACKVCVSPGQCSSCQAVLTAGHCTETAVHELMDVRIFVLLGDHEQVESCEHRT